MPLSVESIFDVTQCEETELEHLSLTENPSPVTPHLGGVGWKIGGDLQADGSGARWLQPLAETKLMTGIPWGV